MEAGYTKKVDELCDRYSLVKLLVAHSWLPYRNCKLS
ncbi:uncharacterized protein G2W53_044175 [Senna tora]|uniref:Uncharacterized protein n=1 Tax=Senna tora TaxID=362788 RepID=A0A834SWW9_9FABA|nr:uncharacterized protein G2W53_044175 [Senna tora]